MPKGDREKLKADIEDGHTPIANLLLEALAMVPLSGVEKGAILALWRVTYGWQNGNKRKTEETISLEGWARMLNTSPAYAARVVRQLVNNKVLIQKDLGQGMGFIYSMNTRVDQWVKGKLNGIGLTERFSVPLTKRYRVPPTKKYTPSATNLATPKKTSKKHQRKDNNNGLTLIFNFIRENMKRGITPHIQQRITEFSQLFSPEQILEAFKLAHENNKAAGYAFGILEDWRVRGYKAGKPEPARHRKKPVPKLWPNSECKISLSGFFVGKNKNEN